MSNNDNNTIEWLNPKYNSFEPATNPNKIITAHDGKLLINYAIIFRYLKFGAAFSLTLYIISFFISFDVVLGSPFKKEINTTLIAPDTAATSEEIYINVPPLVEENNEVTFNKTTKTTRAQYIRRFYKTAQAEMKLYNIPASIKLAQGLLESNAGNGKLARKNNNHFGIKCFSKKCSKTHCGNYTDDSHKDFFRNYETAWESWRAHSKFLGGKRYRHLKKLSPTDYEGWAKGLKEAGYATDELYAEKLIRLIETNKLYKFDKA